VGGFRLRPNTRELKSSQESSRLSRRERVSSGIVGGGTGHGAGAAGNHGWRDAVAFTGAGGACCLKGRRRCFHEDLPSGVVFLLMPKGSSPPSASHIPIQAKRYRDVFADAPPSLSSQAGPSPVLVALFVVPLCCHRPLVPLSPSPPEAVPSHMGMTIPEPWLGRARRVGVIGVFLAD